MPFKSVRQRKYMWMRHPEIARRWTDKYGSKVVSSNTKRETIQRRLGKPRTEVERRKRHKTRFGITKLPPRGFKFRNQ